METQRTYTYTFEILVCLVLAFMSSTLWLVAKLTRQKQQPHCVFLYSYANYNICYKIFYNLCNPGYMFHNLRKLVCTLTGDLGTYSIDSCSRGQSYVGLTANLQTTYVVFMDVYFLAFSQRIMAK